MEVIQPPEAVRTLMRLIQLIEHKAEPCLKFLSLVQFFSVLVNTQVVSSFDREVNV